MCLKMHFISLAFWYWHLIWSRSLHPPLQCSLLVLAYMSGDLDAYKGTFWEKMIFLWLMYPLSFVEWFFLDQGQFCRQTLVQWSPEIWIKRRLEKRRYSLWNSHRILADLQLEKDNIFSSQWISISLFEHLKNGALGPLSLGMGVHTKGHFVQVCLTKCKVTQSSFFGSTIRMSAYLKNLLLLELAALSFSCSTSLHTRENCILRTN